MKKILVVDDESPIAEMISDFCESCGLETKVLNSGEDVLEVVRTYKPDLITMDLVMPGPSGIEVIELLKSHEETKRIPVIVVSAIADDESVQQIRALSQGVLRKPVNMKALESKITTLLSNR